MECKSFIGAHDEHWEDDGLRSHQELEITLIMEGSGRFCARQGSESGIRERGSHSVRGPHSFHALSPIRFGVLLADRIPSEVKELFDRLIQDGRTRIIALSRLDRDRYERLFREWLRIRSAPLKDPIRNYAVWVELLLLFLTNMPIPIIRRCPSHSSATTSVSISRILCMFLPWRRWRDCPRMAFASSSPKYTA